MKMLERIQRPGLVVRLTAAAALFGLTLAALNVLASFVLKEGIFIPGDLLPLSLWHLLACSVLGVFLGLLLALASFFWKRVLKVRFALWAGLALFLSFIALAAGYVNFYAIRGILSLKGIVLNLAILLASILLIAFFIKKRPPARPGRLRRFLLVWVCLLVIVNLVSFAWDRGWLRGASSRGEEAGPAKRPNIIFITWDATRPDHLGCYGYERETTPHLDRMASRGVLFRRASATSNSTQTSVPCLFTSLYPTSLRLRKLTSFMPEGVYTLPFLMKTAGYKTAVFSSNYFVSRTYGYKKGVDVFYEHQRGFIRRSLLYLYLHRGVNNTLRFRPLEKALRWSMSLFPSSQSLPDTDPETVTRYVVDWIEENRHRPFFIYAHFEGGHFPYQSPEPFNSLFAPDLAGKPLPDFLNSEEASKLYAPHSPEMVRLVAQYDGKIRFHDHELGRLIEELRRLGLEENTVILLTADHGEEFLDHGRLTHSQSLFEEMTHVPLVWYGPGYLPQGKVMEGPAAHVDILPTLCSLVGIKDAVKIPYGIEGLDLLPSILSPGADTPRQFVYSEMLKDDIEVRSCKTGRYKAIWEKRREKESRMLFDLSADPGELKNIAGDFPHVWQELQAEMESTRKIAEKKAFRSKTTVLDDMTKERLKALGYIR